MENFNFHNPVKILFGKGKTSEMSDLIPKDVKVLMTFGGGSIKKNGVYDQVKEALKEHDVIEFGGIEPNPTYETAMKAVEIIKKENIGFILSVGGGSVLDSSKFMAAAARFKGEEPWDILSKAAAIDEAIPVGAVLTLPATGSEMNGNSVVSRKSTQEKLAFSSPMVLPQFSVLDPEFTYTLPKRQVINGVVDAFVHVMEQYLTYPVNSPVQDRMAEGILLTLIEEGPKAVANDTPDYDNKANIMWAATMALNGIINVGVKQDWATHVIGHELTAYHGIDHAITLSIVLPGLMTRMKNKRKEKLLQYAQRVWGESEGDEEAMISNAITKTEAFFRDLGAKTLLSEHKVREETVKKIVERFENRGMMKIAMQQDISLQDVEEILMSRL